MPFTRTLLVLRMRLRALFQRERLDAELDEELQDHLARQIDANVHAGMTPADARRAAMLAMGGLERRKDEARDTRGLAALDAVRQDFTYAWRALRGKPGFTAAIVVTLGLGIGANAAMFGIIDRLMFRPPALLHAPDRVHRVYVSWISQGHDLVERTLSYRRFRELTEWTTAFDASVAIAHRTLPLRVGDELHEVNAAAVSGGFFALFDARPHLGRFITTADDSSPSGTPVAVLGYAIWQSRFGSDAGILGKQIELGNATFTIVGVAPRALHGLGDGPETAVYVPVTAHGYSQTTSYHTNHGWTWLDVFVRRKPGVTAEMASADLTSAFRRSWIIESEVTKKLPSVENARPTATAGNVLLSRGPDATPESKIVGLTTGVAAIVLLIACANVTNLLLARTLSRRREIAVRLALGVTWRRLLQQLLAESLLLAGLGALVGLAAAQWGGKALRALLLGMEDSYAVVTDARTLVFVGVLAAVAAIVTSSAPAMHAVRGELTESLKLGHREGMQRRSRLRAGLLLVQATLSTVLLVGAALFVRSFDNVRDLRLGYDADSVVYVQAASRGASLTKPEQNAFNERLVAAALTVPGVRHASLTVSVPFGRDFGRGVPFVPGVDSVAKLGRFTSQAGSPTYFATMGTRILRGRGISSDDRPGSPRVVIVSESMAKALWPGQDPLGKQIRIGRDTTPFSTVVGVAEDLRGRDLRRGGEFWYYMPMAQYVAFYGSSDATLFVRVAGRATDYVEIVRRQLQHEAQSAAFVRTNALSDVVGSRRRPWQIAASLFVAFGALALALAAIGLYSVISYGVAQRAHEIGVRMALGARVADIVRMVVSRGVAFAAGGILLGGSLALLAGRWIEPMLFAQSPRDPSVFAIVGATLIAVAIVATLRPAIRATRLDPTIALKSE